MDCRKSQQEHELYCSEIAVPKWYKMIEILELRQLADETKVDFDGKLRLPRLDPTMLICKLTAIRTIQTDSTIVRDKNRFYFDL
uniref:Uncharacterized protein n=1 Tax=Romanomermis culicivorax TaxID=13658 RepID=A0A915L2H0_ROMCU